MNTLAQKYNVHNMYLPQQGVPEDGVAPGIDNDSSGSMLHCQVTALELDAAVEHV